MTRKPLLLPLVAAMLVAACGSRDADKSGNDLISSIAEEVATEVREDIATDTFGLNADGFPTAELTPEGDLLIDGRKIALNAEQRRLALDYRQAISDVAERGARIGLQGAEVGMDAAKAAIAGVVSGNTAEIEAEIRDSTDRIKAEALKLCEALPSLLAKEQALAAAVPEFAPYAEMTQSQVDDCLNDPDLHVDASATGMHDEGDAPSADDANERDTDDASIEEDATKPYGAD